jgi:hypothetical protein
MHSSHQLQLVAYPGERAARASRRGAPPPRVRPARGRHRPSLRQRAAVQLIRLGERLAVEPVAAPARSR